MNRHVNAITGRLSLRPPQRISLETLHRITEIAPPGKEADTAALLAAIQSEFASVTDFEREFPSLCFALATGVGKTRLMGAFVCYLYLDHGIGNFFVLAPNLTIYNKLIADFTPNTPKYVFKGIAEFAVHPPMVITGDTYESGVGVREAYRRQASMFPELDGVHINIFNISKINSEVRGGKSPRIKRLSEYIGESYFDYLAGLPDLVLLDDHADLLYDLAGQVVRHFQSHLSDDETRKILRCYQRDIARFVHAQMQAHYWEEAVAYKVVVSKGFSELKESAYSYSVAEPPVDYGVSPEDKSNMSRFLFGGFNRCLYPVQKFDSEAERKLAAILERDALKWFKPAKGQFQMIYAQNHGGKPWQ